MRRSSDLEARLTEWANEYGGGRHENIGWQGVSPLASVIKYHGRAPEGLNPARVVTNGAADEVEEAVRALGSQRSGVIPAAVLRCEYNAREVGREVRIQRLARVGCRITGTGRGREARYCQHLRTAKVYVAGRLRLPFDEMLADEDAIDMLEYIVQTGS
ncbi:MULTISPECIES: hypothetical protein [Luteibacter]|uniref:hypothetical protein n=1 Tax=Luteibacter TaxID=242605 RepID=UPI00056B01A4|nr:MULTISPECIES: hypothetical protein [unclassified Luteibacter]